LFAGYLTVAPEARAAYLDDALAVVRAARAAPGCVDFYLSADPIDPARINIFGASESAFPTHRRVAWPTIQPMNSTGI
jgi:quinol monooxygenase YgiN